MESAALPHRSTDNTQRRISSIDRHLKLVNSRKQADHHPPPKTCVNLRRPDTAEIAAETPKHQGPKANRKANEAPTNAPLRSASRKQQGDSKLAQYIVVLLLVYTHS